MRIYHSMLVLMAMAGLLSVSPISTNRRSGLPPVPAVRPNDSAVFANYGLRYYPPQLPEVQEDALPAAVFIHAAVGIFRVKRKKPGQTNDFWGYGREIMEEILETVRASGLMSRQNTQIYVTLLGNDKDVGLAEKTLHKFNSTAGNVHLLIRGRDLYVSELPTIHAIHLYSLECDPRTAVLYLHTKGMRHNGLGATDWRRYMVYFLAERWELCLGLLHARSRSRAYDTCGVEASSHEYMGNMWWSSAHWLRQTRGVQQFPWNMNSRYEAEDFLFLQREDSRVERRSYCMFHITHSLYDCPTPPELYTGNNSVPTPLRQQFVCYRPPNIVRYITDKGISCFASKISSIDN